MDSKEFPSSEGNEQISLSDFGKSAMANGVCFLLSAVMSHASDLEMLSPLGIAFCTGTSREYTLFSCLGGMMGYLLSSDRVTSFRYIMTLLLIYILKAYINSFEKLKNKVLPFACVALFSTASTGIIVSFTTTFTLETVFARLTESSVAFGGAYVFTVAQKSLKRLKENKSLNNRELVLLVVSLLAVLMAFSGISLFGVTISGVACSFFVMCCGYIFGEKGGAVVGTGASLSLVLTGRAAPYTFAYSVAGLFSGLFSYSGRVLFAMSYIFSYGAIYLFSGGNGENYAAPLVESALASVFFVLTPQKFFGTVKARLFTVEENKNQAVNMMSLKMDMIKNGIDGLNKTLDFVTEKLKGSEPPQTAGIYLRVRDRVCSECASYDKCWKNELFKTIGEFDSIIEIIRKEEHITPTGVPMSLQGRCIRIMSLCDSFNKNYASYCTALGTEGKINQMRKITKNQFITMSDLLEDMKKDFERGFRPLYDKSNMYKGCLHDMGIDADVICYEDEGFNRFINITVDNSCGFDGEEIREVLQRADEKKLNSPAVLEGEKNKTLLFCEKPYYKVSCDYFQASGTEGNVCGDCFDTFYDGRGNFVAVLSDGMGTGNRAAIDGNMTAGLFSKLIIWGFSFPCALKLVNSAMLLKSSQESMATLDILKINLYTGQAIIYKAGATVSLMKRQGKVSTVKKAAMPVGILPQTEFATVKGSLRAGDEIILMSDGATDNGIKEMKSFLSASRFKEGIAEQLCTLSREKTADRCDDITVSVIRLSKNE